MSITHRDIKDYAVFLNGVKIFDSDGTAIYFDFASQIMVEPVNIEVSFDMTDPQHIPLSEVEREGPDLWLELEPDQVLAAADTKPLVLDYLELSEPEPVCPVVQHGRQ